MSTRRIWNDCHGSGIAAQIHRSPDLDTVRIEGRNEGLVRDDNIPIDDIDGYRYRCRDGDERSFGSTRADSRYRVSAILCHQDTRYRRRQDRWDSRNPTEERSWFRPE